MGRFDIINSGIESALNNFQKSPNAFCTELDLHTEIYRVLYDKLRKHMYFNKNPKKRDKIIHSNWYAKAKTSVRRKTGIKNFYFDMSILGNGYDVLFEIKYGAAHGYKHIHTDINKIAGAIDKSKIGVIVNVNPYGADKLYSSKNNLSKALKKIQENFKRKVKTLDKYKNKKTTVYYYYLYCNFYGDYLKITWKIKNSIAKLLRVVYNGKSIDINNL